MCLENLHIQARQIDDTWVIAIAGELDHFSVEEASECLGELCNDCNRIVLDARELSYLSSASARILLPLLKRVRQHGGDLKICGLCGKARLVAELMGLDKFVDMVAKTPEEAVARFSEPVPTK